MSLIKCPECGKEVSDTSNICVHCGYDIKNYVINDAKSNNDKLNKENTIKKTFRINPKMILGLLISVLIIISISLYLIKPDKKLEETLQYIDDFKAQMDYIYLPDATTVDWFLIPEQFEIADRDLSSLIASYENLSDSSKKKCDNAIYDAFGINYSELTTKWSEYGITGSTIDPKTNTVKDKDYYQAGFENYANSLKGQYVTNNMSLTDQIAIIDNKLVGDGDYYTFEATLQNNSSTTYTYLKYTIFIYDSTGSKIIDSSWGNWSGTFLPKSQIHVDTMFKRYTHDKAKFRVSIDEAV